MSTTLEPNERPAALSSCSAKHTKYNPSGAEWKCPKCSKTALDPDGFFNDEPASDAQGDCPALHEHDALRCYSCGYGTTGKAFAARLQKAANMVPCPTCKGHGLVKGEKAWV